MRRVIEIFLRLTVIAGNTHPHLRAVIENYAALLFFRWAMTQSRLR